MELLSQRMIFLKIFHRCKFCKITVSRPPFIARGLFLFYNRQRTADKKYMNYQKIFREEKKLKLKYLGAVSLVCAGLFFVSCGSTPTAEENLDFDPTQTETQAEGPVQETVQEAADFSASNQALLEGAEKARQAAVEADAQKYYPQKFDETDKWYVEVKNKVSSDSKADCSSDIKDVTDKFNALAKASLARSMKDRADELGFAGEDKDSYGRGQKALEEYDALAANSGSSELLAKADEAFNAYSQLMLKGFKAFAGRERNAALEAKKNADSVKAGVAKKEEYKKASDNFKAADSDYVTKNIESAYRGYKSAKEIYTELYETVSKNRAAAQEAIERAKQKVAEAESYSSEADSIAPIEGEVAGIEKEDAVLLESDNLANPDDAVINVEEGNTAEAAEKEAAAAIAVEDAANQVLEAK